MKRGQVTIFVILGILMLVVLYLFLFSASFKQDSFNDLDVDLKHAEIQMFVNSCLEYSLNDAIAHISDLNYNNPLFQNDLIEQEIQQIIIEEFPLCINNFSSFEIYDVVIKDNPYDLSVFVGDTRTFANLNYPLNISKENQVIFLNEFSASVDFDYASIRDSIQGALSSIAPEYFEHLVASDSDNLQNEWFNAPSISSTKISDLTQKAMEEGFTYNYIYGGEGRSVLVFEFDAENLPAPITHTISIPQEPFISSEPFYLSPIPVFEFKGEDIIYEIYPNNRIRFEENSDFLSITNEGILTISGNIPQGITRELIKATNNNGEVAYQYVIINY
jgi:hypothetical protein